MEDGENTITMRHRISKSEVRYGRLWNKKGGTYALYASMPEYFEIYIRGHTLEQKRFNANKVYVSEEIMGMFEEVNIVDITKENRDTVRVELVSGDDT